MVEVHSVDLALPHCVAGVDWTEERRVRSLILSALGGLCTANCQFIAFSLKETKGLTRWS